MAEDYFNLRMDERAVAMYEKYLSLNPDDYEASSRLLRDLYLPKGDFNKAEKLVETMLRKNRYSTTLKLLLSDLYLKNNKIEQAVKNSVSFLVDPAVRPDIYKYIANSFIRTNKTDIGISVFESLLDNFKSNDKIYNAMKNIKILIKTNASRKVWYFLGIGLSHLYQKSRLSARHFKFFHITF